jgi:hypothetical protein
LVQDYQAHKGLNGLLDHFLKYGFGDADPDSAAGKNAQDETQKFLDDFKNLLVANLGKEGAQEALLKIQAAAGQLTENGIKNYVNQIYNELIAPADKPTQDPVIGPISTKTHAEEDAQRQCDLGNPAACEH